jgi:serine/threonine protein kinase SCH9
VRNDLSILSEGNGWYHLSGRCRNEDWIVGEILLELEYRSSFGKREYGVKDFQLSKLIRKGRTGQVYQVRKCDTNGVYAMKVYPKRGLSQGGSVDQRARLSSPFLADIRFAFQDTTNMYCLMDFQPGGELFWHLQHQRFREDEAKFYTAEIILALRELHRHGFQAVDLKPAKILLSATGHIVLVDFFLAMKDLHGLDTISNSLEPTEYSAPEALLGEKRTNVMDFWTLGVLTFEMCMGWSPFYAYDTKEMFKNIAFGKCHFPRDTPSANGRSFIKGLLNRKPGHRLGAQRDVEELMEHPFFSDIDWVALSQQRTIPPRTPRIGVSARTPRISVPSRTPRADVPTLHFNSESIAFSRPQDPSSLGSIMAGTLPSGPSMPGTFSGDTLVEHSRLEKYLLYVDEGDSNQTRSRDPSTDPKSSLDTSKMEPISVNARDSGVFEPTFKVW